MEKLKLVLEDLAVESFEVASESDSVGTVQAFGILNPFEEDAALPIKTDNPYDNTCGNTCPGKYTCPSPTMCENSCWASSPHICC